MKFWIVLSLLMLSLLSGSAVIGFVSRVAVELLVQFVVDEEEAYAVSVDTDIVAESIFLLTGCFVATPTDRTVGGGKAELPCADGISANSSSSMSSSSATRENIVLFGWWSREFI